MELILITSVIPQGEKNKASTFYMLLEFYRFQILKILEIWNYFSRFELFLLRIFNFQIPNSF